MALLNKIKNLFPIIVLMSFFAGCTNGCATASMVPQGSYISTTNHVSHIMNSVVNLVAPMPGHEAESNPEYHSYCTAFFVDQRTIVTAEHCVADRLEIVPGLEAVVPPEVGKSVSFITYQQYTKFSERHIQFVPHVARLINFDEGTDVAILRISAPLPDVAYLTINDTTIQIGETTFVCGHPFSFNWYLTQGIVSQVERDEHGSLTAIFSSGVYFGNSGGPLINDRGEVIGVVHAITHPPGHDVVPHLSIFVPIRFATQLISEVDHP